MAHHHTEDHTDQGSGQWSVQKRERERERDERREREREGEREASLDQCCRQNDVRLRDSGRSTRRAAARDKDVDCFEVPYLSYVVFKRISRHSANLFAILVLSFQKIQRDVRVGGQVE